MSIYHKIAGLFAFIGCDVLTEEYLKKIRYVVKKETIMNTFLRYHIKTFKYPFWNHIHELNILYYIKAYLSILHFEQIFYLYVILINTSKMKNTILKIQRELLTIFIVSVKTIIGQTQSVYPLWCNDLVFSWKAVGWRGQRKQGITTCSFHKLVYWVLCIFQMLVHICGIKNHIHYYNLSFDEERV